MSNTIRTIVIDDEKEARDGIELLLAPLEKFKLICHCENGLEAIRAIEEQKPDLIFLDIQMPKINGFEVLNSLSSEVMPKVIFVTAYDKYALKAFQVHAIDYLLKPFSNTRFYEATNHILSMFEHEKTDLMHLRNVIDTYLQQTEIKSNEQLITSASNSHSIPEQLIVKSEGKIVFISLADITHIEAQNYKVKVYGKNRQYVVRESLKSLEEYLQGTTFMRIHKSVIVNSQYVKEVEPYFNGEMILKLLDGTKLKVSRHYRKNLPKVFG